MEEFPIGKKRPQQKKPGALDESRAPPQRGQQKHKVEKNQCVRDFHGVKAYPSMGHVARR
jgi:hypothetical protein